MSRFKIAGLTVAVVMIISGPTTAEAAEPKEEAAQIADIQLSYFDRETGAFKLVDDSVAGKFADLVVAVKIVGEPGMGIRGRKIQLDVTTDEGKQPSQKQDASGVAMGTTHRAFIIPAGMLCGEFVITAVLTGQKTPAKKSVKKSFDCGGD